jgi:hypothetical protein
VNGRQLATAVRRELNRPDDDDILDETGDLGQYYTALTTERDKARGKVVDHAPHLLVEETTLTADDGTGETYTLEDDHLGSLELYAPPGPRTGRRIYPGSPGMAEERFWMEGRIIRMTLPRSFSPGLYVRWIPVTVDAIDSDSTDSGLPLFMDDYLVLATAARLARRPGLGVDFRVFENLRDEAWLGRRGDPSDTGLLNTLKKHAANVGVEAQGAGGSPWWHGVPGFGG